jgi:hypothetical protein
MPGTAIVIGFGDPHYSHMTALAAPVRATLARDFE